MTLAELAVGVPARVESVDSGTGIVHRLMEMGLVPGADVVIRRVAPLGDPLQLRVGSYDLSIRRREARSFRVKAR